MTTGAPVGCDRRPSNSGQRPHNTRLDAVHARARQRISIDAFKIAETLEIAGCYDECRISGRYVMLGRF